MIEREVWIDSGSVRLAGTLCLPAAAGVHPTVLMVHGTGPLDRDQNMPGQALNVFNTIAHALAASGIASLRYDKRGCGQSTGDYYSAGHNDLIADAVACLHALRAMPECDAAQLYVLGHSEGCLIAPQAALRSSAVAGLILLCPFVQPVEHLLIRQAAAIQRDLDVMPGVGGWLQRSIAKLFGGVVRNQERLIARIKASEQPSLRRGSQTLPAKSLREMMSLNIASLFSQLHALMLLIGAEKDLQCDPHDVYRIAQIAPGSVTARVIDNLTHGLRREPGRPTLLGGAALLDKPVDAEVLELVTAWLVENTKPRLDS